MRINAPNRRNKSYAAVLREATSFAKRLSRATLWGKSRAAGKAGGALQGGFSALQAAGNAGGAL